MPFPWRILALIDYVPEKRSQPYVPLHKARFPYIYSIELIGTQLRDS